jgi:uracil-DNA glycosylase
VISTASSTIANSSSPKDRKRPREEDDDIVEIVDTLTSGSATITSSSSSSESATTSLSSSFSIHPSWKKVLDTEASKAYFMKLTKFVQSRRDAGAKVYPPSPLVLNALLLTPLDQVKVVILGQDPYHGPGQAHGLSFSVPKKCPIPSSLDNIYKNLLKFNHILWRPSHGDLSYWSYQGVLLLNSALTVKKGEANSCQYMWSEFTDEFVKILSSKYSGIIFVLWGKHAHLKQLNGVIKNQSKHKFIVSSHPSGYSANTTYREFQSFIDTDHFGIVNKYLTEQNKIPIDWQIV